MTVSATCTITGLALTTLSYTASKTGYVTQTDIPLTEGTIAATVLLTAIPTYGLVVTVTGRASGESIIVSVSGGYTCTIATTAGTGDVSCTVTVPAGVYTVSATSATRQGSGSITVTATSSTSIEIS